MYHSQKLKTIFFLNVHFLIRTFFSICRSFRSRTSFKRAFLNIFVKNLTYKNFQRLFLLLYFSRPDNDYNFIKKYIPIT